MPTLAQTDEEILGCFSVVKQLRPNLRQQDFLGTVRSMQRDGFQLLRLQEGDQTVAVAGFRIYENLFMGKHLYIDDLITDEAHRSKGHGETLIQWLKQHAKEQGCRVLHLDSGTQRHRAHRFYLRQGFDIASFHFSQKL